MPHRKQQRNTPQRKIVLEEIRSTALHPTAVELFEIVRRRLPKISLGTVYRNLELLSRSGTIQKLTSSGSEARFDGNPRHHYHVRCIYCDRVEDVQEVQPSKAVQQPKMIGGYEILDHRLEFVGVCPGCKDKTDRDEATSPAEVGL